MRAVRAHLGGWRTTAILLGDIVVLNCGLWLALSLRWLQVVESESYINHLVPFNLLFVIWLFVFVALGLYDLRRAHVLPWLIRGIFIATTVNWVIGITYLYFFQATIGMTPRANFILIVITGHVCVVVWRRIVANLMRARPLTQRVAFFGNVGQIQEFRREMKRHPQLGLMPVPDTRSGVDAIIADGRWVERNWSKVKEPIADAIRRRVPILDMAGFYEELFGKVSPENAGNFSWMLGSVLSHGAAYCIHCKRVLDVFLASLGLIAAFPFLAVVFAAIRLFDGKPAFFSQKRVGFMGKEFRLWKFRTMKMGNGAGRPFTSRRQTDLRVTRLGSILRRFRIDELPQLWNVLRGEMSLVGPRPEWTKEVEVLEKVIPEYHLRHMVNPGITGWAQLNFRATNNPRDSIEKLRFDLYYVKNISMVLDIYILLRTIRRLFVREIRSRYISYTAVESPGRSSRVMLEFPAILGRNQT